MLGDCLAGRAHRKPLRSTAAVRFHGVVADTLREFIRHVLLFRGKHDLDGVVGHEVAGRVNPVDGPQLRRALDYGEKADAVSGDEGDRFCQHADIAQRREFVQQ